MFMRSALIALVLVTGASIQAHAKCEGRYSRDLVEASRLHGMKNYSLTEVRVFSLDTLSLTIEHNLKQYNYDSFGKTEAEIQHLQNMQKLAEVETNKGTPSEAILAVSERAGMVNGRERKIMTYDVVMVNTVTCERISNHFSFEYFPTGRTSISGRDW
ncbi:hypothetical protein [Bdellovibrio sp. HCB2-146]|uniref:hypothetical protein n=1 Tax=Bdellovibrio sp. HCB2-146 TaxID=3394362 RepID=UPI0039BCA1C3